MWYFITSLCLQCDCFRRPEPPCESANDPVVKAIIDYCGRLYHLIRQWNSDASAGEEEGTIGSRGHASGCVDSDVRRLIVSWLANTKMVSGCRVRCSVASVR